MVQGGAHDLIHHIKSGQRSGVHRKQTVSLRQQFYFSFPRFIFPDNPFACNRSGKDGRGLILVLNKWDLVEGPRGEREIQRQLERKLGFVPDPVVLRTSAKTGLRVRRLIPEALELMRQLRLEIPTAEVNRALEEAILRYSPPMKRRRQARFFYATQTSTRPLTLVVFVNDPDLIPANYRKYIESFFRKRFGVRSAPVRVRFRARRESAARR